MTDVGEGLRYPPEVVERYVAGGYWTDEKPQDWLARWATETPEALAVIGPNVTLSYAALHGAVRRTANGLLNLGFRKGDAIGLQLPNLPEFLIAFHGIQLMGGVACLLHMPYRAGELAPMLNHAGAKGIVCYQGLPGYDAVRTMAGLKGTVPTLETIIVVGDDPRPGSIPFAALQSADDRDVADPPQAADAAVLAFTSGTSAKPKAVVHPYRTLACSHRQLSADGGLRRSDVVLSAPPFTHIYGLCVANITLHIGAASSLMPMYAPEAFVAAIERGPTTVMFCGPAHVLACLKAGLFHGRDLRSLRTVVFAGSACPPGLTDTMERMCGNATAYQMWGMTEVLMSFINPLDALPEIRRWSIGTPPAGHEIRAVSGMGEVLGPGEEGEMQICGPFVFARYLRNEEANRTAFTPDGWFRTGDLVRIDTAGNVEMTGRLKDIINRGGIKINPVEIEAMMDEHPAVAQSAIVPMPDEVMGEKACLCVALKPGATLTLEDMQRYLGDRNVAKMLWPERVEVIEAMPMTPTRKIIKGELAARIAER